MQVSEKVGVFNYKPGISQVNLFHELATNPDSGEERLNAPPKCFNRYFDKHRCPFPWFLSFHPLIICNFISVNV